MFGSGSIFVGSWFLLINYKGNQKKARNFSILLVCTVIGVCGLILPLYLTLYREDFGVTRGWLLTLGGIGLAFLLWLFAVKVGIFVFTQFLGFVAGFSLCNTLEICILFRF